MTDLSKKQNEGADDMDDVGRLIQHAGAREPVDYDRMENARDRVAAHWTNVVASRQAARSAYRFRLISIAASILAVIGMSFLYLQPTNTALTTELAKVERVLGAVSIANLTAVKGIVVKKDTQIETDTNSRVALRMAGGQSLRVDHSSRLIVHSPNHVSLEKGAIYIDTEFASDSLPIQVATPMGTARDVGTQFQVRLGAAVLIIGVRDGKVEVATNDQQSLSVNKGRYLELAISGQQSERPIQNADPSWDWIETIVPDYEIEGTSLKQYLIWYANERGFELKWSDGVSEEKAGNVMLSGSIEGASLDEGIQIVRQIAPFEYTIDGDSMWVRID